ncbi:MAG TPA: arginase family protein [Lacisediminihabitans sp.]|nr:arginase family protein [Lacisediminihabitans sp.]HXD61836.1 arginase family protein [Lacisediminihabitans sp.]
MTLSHDPLWPRAGGWPAPSGGSVDLALLGIPTWRTSITPGGAGSTPAAVRSALHYYSEYWPADRAANRAVDARALVAEDWGDCEEPDGTEGRAIESVAAAARAATLLVALGGDNAATVPAALGTWGDRLSTAGLVTVDAHHDLRDGISNGSPVRRLVEAGLDGTRIVQVGIADFANSAEYAARAAEYGITVIHRDELARRPMADVMAEALEIAGAAGGPIHVDLDVDVCDRSVAPACPAALPGGISAYELRTAARVAGAHPLVESVDLTEVDASTDTPDGRTVRLVALCVLELAAAARLRR